MPKTPNPRPPLSYRDAGVDIDAGNTLVERIKPAAKSTLRPEVLAGLGGFGGLCELPRHYARPVLVAATDGVGTKLKLAQALGRHSTIGIDLVAMCVNDVLAQGAEPLFFLDYFATGKLEVDAAAEVIEGIAEGCRQAGAALIGGETAEMPGLYQNDDYDLAGFCVGVAEKDRLLDGSAVRAGDTVVGIAASGIHSNGYSLVRRILADGDIDLNNPFGDTSLGEVLLTPTRVYVSLLLPLLRSGGSPIHALAHITGGGLPENLPRVLPDGCKAVIDPAAWPRPPIFVWLREIGNVPEDEMLRTFNCGIGMAAVTGASDAAELMEHCRRNGVDAWMIGHIVSAEGAPCVEII